MARNTTKNNEMRDARLKSIKKAALTLFASKGVAATKIQDIAKAADMSQGLIYHYYPSKEAIYLEMMHESLDKIIGAVMSLKAMPLSASEKIKFGISGLLDIIADNEDFSQTSHLIMQTVFMDMLPEDEKSKINQKRDIPYREIEAILTQGQLDGTIYEGDAKELAILFWVTINGLSLVKATTLDYYVQPQAETLYRLFIKE
ncbi:TetR/AcrR family transcriptional regulator [Fusibacter bizertensis]|uniref:TetR/AcrR family transcriptional regulator n=1 Tax=Fusibacter bizertensis TaxID=1488331 RepID=A0ABT6NE87_9FIRM|nr:TetR/AcrR family transcriptional regulator [Fusibacter bizertensis]MDH8678717.1 TetR/AcrR family transcriptional regulator [Fusibacter bizertensis]